MDIIQTLQQLPQHSIILISGFGGSGKSTFAQTIAEHISCTVIESDDFYRDMKDYVNWECYDFNRLIKEVIAPYTEGRSSSYWSYNWHHPSTPIRKHMGMKDYLIIEGVGLLREELLTYADYTIWLDCDIDRAIEQGKKRDKERYHVDHDELWDGIWKRNEMTYYETHQPATIADSIVPSFLQNKNRNP